MSTISGPVRAQIRGGTITVAVGADGLGIAVRVTGRVVRFDDVRGYGFITPDGGGDDVFLHVNDLEMEKRLATPGTVVSFEIDEGDRGKFARGVRLSTGATTTAHSESYSDENSAGDEYFDVLSAEEFLHEVTERLLHIHPPLDAVQILAVRGSFEELARKQGLIDS